MRLHGFNGTGTAYLVTIAWQAFAPSQVHRINYGISFDEFVAQASLADSLVDLVSQAVIAIADHRCDLLFDPFALGPKAAIIASAAHHMYLYILLPEFLLSIPYDLRQFTMSSTIYRLRVCTLPTWSWLAHHVYAETRLA